MPSIEENKNPFPAPTPRKSVRYSSPLVAAEYEYTPEVTPTSMPTSPVGRQRTTISVQWREPNPGEVSSLYPWYYGNDNVNAPTESPKKSGQRNSRSKASKDVEMTDAVEVDDDATIVDEDPYADIKLNRLPAGLKLEDIRDPDERENFEKRMEVASSTAVLAQSLDNEQVMWFLSEIKDGPITRYFNWNKVQLAEAETQVAFGVEDIIRDAYITGATEYPVNEDDPDQAVDAYSIMENIYFQAANTRGDIKKYSTATPKEKNTLGRYRDLSHDVRARDIVARIKAVEKKWKETTPRRYRSIATIRRAFDHLSNMYHPNYPWPCSHAFFEATLDIIRVNEVYCMLVFEEDTDTFVEMLHKAMVDAEKRRMKDWIEARTDEQFYDLMGTGLAPDFEDEIKIAPNPYSSATSD